MYFIIIKIVILRKIIKNLILPKQRMYNNRRHVAIEKSTWEIGRNEEDFFYILFKNLIS